MNSYSTSLLAVTPSTVTTQALMNVVCHEIRDSLNGIVAGNEWLDDVYHKFVALSPGATADYAMALENLAEAIHIMQHSADKIKHHIDDALDLGKLGAGKIELHKIRFDPKETIYNIIKPLESQFTRKGITVDLYVDPINRMIEADEFRLSQVLSNLISNAIKFTENGLITVSLFFTSTIDISPEEKQDILPNMMTANEEPAEEKSEQKYLKCVITDTGIGIDAQMLTKLFSPFSQASAETSHYFGGTGLGLSICKQLVELMGGQIGAWSQKGQKTTFAFTIGCELFELYPKANPKLFKGISVHTSSSQIISELDLNADNASAKASFESGGEPHLKSSAISVVKAAATTMIKVQPVTDLRSPRKNKNTCWFSCWNGAANFFQLVRDCKKEPKILSIVKPSYRA